MNVLNSVLNKGSRTSGSSTKNFFGGNRISRAFHNVASGGRKIGHVARTMSSVISSINNSSGGILSNIPAFSAGIGALNVVGRMADSFRTSATPSNSSLVPSRNPMTQGYV